MSELELSFLQEKEVWTLKAACLGCAPELFFPVKGKANTATMAKRVCMTCPVRVECLNYALRMGDKLYGVWGGKSAKERRPFIKEYKNEHKMEVLEKEAQA